MTRPLIYVINLDRSPDRWTTMTVQLADEGLEPIRVPAVDAKRDMAEMAARRGFPVPKGDEIFARNAEGRRYLIGEEACFESHLKALAMFLDAGAETALILEDDAGLAPGFARLLDAASACARDWDAVRLESAGRRGERKALEIATLPDGYHLVASLRPCSGSSAYLVNRKGAERLIAVAPGVFEPYDTFLSTVVRHRLRMLDCAPSPVRQSGVASVIHAERDAGTPTATRRSPGLRASLRRLASDLRRRLPRRWLYPAMYRGQGKKWVMAPWNRDW